MLTFDNPGPRNDASAELEHLLKSGATLPDVVECGENNVVWIRVNRKTKSLELVSKQTGAVVTRCKAGDLVSMDWYGLSPQQIGAVKAALQLKAPR